MEKSLMQKQFETLFVAFAEHEGMPADLTPVKINGRFAYYLSPTTQDLWEHIGGQKPPEGKDY